MGAISATLSLHPSPHRVGSCHPAAVPRLDALLARNLSMSRRQVVRAIRAGRVTDETGSRLDDPRLPLTPTELPITVRIDDEPYRIHVRYDVLQNKPLGVVTALTDRRHPTAYALLEGAPLARDLRPVGRLDKETSGLLLWTTDGSLLHRLTHPKYGVEREYAVALARPFEPPSANLVLEDGHRPDISELRVRDPAELHRALDRPPEATVFASIVLTGGKFHEVRRIFAALGSHVCALCRVRYGSISLPDTLDAGDYEPIDLKTIFHGLSPLPAREA